MTLAFALAVLCAFAAPAHARGQLLNFKNYDHQDGLPQVQVRALIQDSRGFLWTGTYGGLSRFDGVGFTTITAKGGLLPSNVVTDLAVDAANELVVATSGGGICFRSHQGMSCIDKSDGLAGNNVTSVLAGPNGSVWVATSDGLSLVRHGQVVRTYGVQDGLPSMQVTHVVLDARGRLWVSTALGSVRMEGDVFVADRAGVPGRMPLTVLGSTSRGLVLTDPDGVFLASEGDVRRLMGPVGRVGNVGRDVAESPDGTIWVATYGGLLRDTDGKIDRLTRANGLTDDRVNRVIVDTEGDVWFGTEGGLTELVPGPFEFYTPASGLPDRFVSGFLQDRRGRIWATTQKGPAIWDGRGFRAVPMPGPAAGAPAFPVANAPDGGVLVGTLGAGLVWVKPSGKATVYGTADGLPSLNVEGLLPDSGGVWITTDRGVARWFRARITVSRDSVLAHANALSLEKDGRGRLWVGLATGGVLVWDGVHVVRLGRAQGLTDQIVWDMARTPDGAIWLGTNGDGALRVEGDSIERLTTASGLTNDFVWQVQPDRTGGMWFFTNHGLDRLRDGTFRHYGRGDGLLDEEGTSAASMQDSSGELWFGVGTGAYRYEPTLEARAEHAPPVYIDGLRAAGRAFPLSGALLPPGFSNLEVAFSSPTYRDRAAVRFRYRLGPEMAWSAPQAEPRVSLAGLGPGTYTLEVVAQNGDGLRSDPPASVTFAVQPKVWQSWWFRGLMMLLLVGAIASVPWARTRRLEREHEDLNRLVLERTQDLAEKTAGLQREIAGREAAEKERLHLEEQLHQAQKMEAIGRLAGGIAHDFNNLLTAVIGHAQLLGQDLGEGHASREDLQEIEDAARRGASLVSQLLAYSRQQIIRQDLVDLNETVDASARLLQRVIGDDVVLEVKKSSGPATVRFDRTQMDQVLVNFAVNAKDAMPAGGRLTFEVGSAEVEETLRDLGPDEVEPGPYVTLQVRDTGMGMDADVLERAFDPFFTTKETGRGTGLGLATVYGAVHQSEGYVQVSSVLGEGTSFILYLPRA